VVSTWLWVARLVTHVCVCVAGLKIDWSQCGQYLVVDGQTGYTCLCVCCRPEDRLVAVRSVPGSGWPDWLDVFVCVLQA